MITSADREYLQSSGITRPGFQELAVEKLPCGIGSVRDAMDDETPWQTNAPRALMLCWYKGLLYALAAAEVQLNAETEKG